MLSKHINDDPFTVRVSHSDYPVGPCECPQEGCNGGYVRYLETGGGSGTYESQAICKCCDGKGRLYKNELPYAAYCRANHADHLVTDYPNPYHMPAQD